MRFNRSFTAEDTILGWEADSAFLYAKLVQPAGEIRAGQIVAIAGSGYFNGLSFDALGPAHGPLLGEQHALVYVGDLLGDAQPFHGPPRHSAVIGSNNTRLKQAEQEAIDVARLLGSNALLGPNARKAKVVQEMRSANWIHFSTD